MTFEFSEQSSLDAARRDDHELLTAFVNGSDNAFAVLVRRHIDAVYSSALRQVRDQHTASDVTSAVFIVLAHKAAALDARTVLSAWLHRTTRYTALKAIRARMRRQHYEQEAARMQDPLYTADSSDTSPAWAEVAPLLDDGLTQLPAKDHQAVVLRFFEHKTFPEIAALVGSTEEGARKRVDRAIEKLRRFFTQRGVVVPATVLAATLAANAVQASPLALAGSINATSAVTALPPLALETLRALRWRLWNRIATSIVVVAIVSGIIFSVLRLYSAATAGSPLQTLRLMSQAANGGDSERWSSFVQVTTAEEQQVRTLLASNVLAQSELRRALIRRFGQGQYETSDFPRLLDDTPESQISAAEERINGDAAVVHLPRGSNLKFVFVSRVWKFDFFRTTAARPAQLRNSIGNDLAALQRITPQVSRGAFQDIRDTLADFQHQRGTQQDPPDRLAFP
jgi:RNA polymerase sigma factor (sigma-70 family)